MNRRQFLRNGLKGTAAYALLPATLLGAHNAMAKNGGGSGSRTTPTKTATEEEIESLLYMREEEKLARDVYLTMYVKWKTHVFSNIADSEQMHTLAVKSLLDAYGLYDPAENIYVCVF